MGAVRPKASQPTNKKSAALTPAARPGGGSAERPGTETSDRFLAAERLLDANDVGKRLKLSPRTVADMANNGRLPAYRVGIYLRFKWADVEQFITANYKVAAPLATGANSANAISTPHPGPLPGRGGEGMKSGREQ